MNSATQLATIPASAEQFFIEQRPDEYTKENQAVWQLLFARRMKHLSPERSSRNVGVWRKYSGTGALARIERELADHLVD